MMKLSSTVALFVNIGLAKMKKQNSIDKYSSTIKRDWRSLFGLTPAVIAPIWELLLTPLVHEALTKAPSTST